VVVADPDPPEPDEVAVDEVPFEPDEVVDAEVPVLAEPPELVLPDPAKGMKGSLLVKIWALGATAVVVVAEAPAPGKPGARVVGVTGAAPGGAAPPPVRKWMAATMRTRTRPMAPKIKARRLLSVAAFTVLPLWWSSEPVLWWWRWPP